MRGRFVALAVLAALVAAGAVVAYVVWPGVRPPACTVSRSDGPGSYEFDPAQTQNGSIVAAEAVRLGLPDHAVTIAIAAALQETKLRNLPTGDRDSLGVFQQRPSQGWGTAAQVMDPAYASSAFYRHLTRVPGWQSMSVNEAAQRVQRSGLPSAYAQWEPRARALARALTGEVPAGVSCAFARFDGPPPARDALTSAASSQFGRPVLGVAVAPKLGWEASAWAVAHAHRYHVGAVTFAGRRWSMRSGRWTPAAPARAVVEVTSCGSAPRCP